MRARLFGASLALSLGAASAGVATADGSVVYGLGGASCRGFVTTWYHMDNVLLRSYKDWLDGFLSAQSATLGRDVKAGRSTDALLPWLVNYCEAHPLKRMNRASEALMRDLVRK